MKGYQKYSVHFSLFIFLEIYNLSYLTFKMFLHIAHANAYSTQCEQRPLKENYGVPSLLLSCPSSLSTAQVCYIYIMQSVP